MSQAVSLELKEKIEKACMSILGDVEGTITDLRNFQNPPNIRDDYDILHLQLLFYSATEGELNASYAQILALKSQVEIRLLRSKEVLEDAKMQALENQGVKMPNSFQSRVEIESKLRSKTFEEIYDVKIWEELLIQVRYVVDVIRAYHSDASRMRRDVDTRIKIKGLQF